MLILTSLSRLPRGYGNHPFVNPHGVSHPDTKLDPRSLEFRTVWLVACRCNRGERRRRHRCSLDCLGGVRPPSMLRPISSVWRHARPYIPFVSSYPFLSLFGYAPCLLRLMPLFVFPLLLKTRPTSSEQKQNLDDFSPPYF